MARYGKNQPIARPSEIRTPEDRGTALRVWLRKKELQPPDFAEAAGVSRATLHRYLTGKKDIATVEQTIADRLLRAMNISDEEVWELLGIPEEHRATFRSFRPPPLGHGALVREDTVLRLSQPLFGSVALPMGTLIRVTLDGPPLEHEVVRLADGRLFSVSSGVQAEGEKMGYLVSAHFAMRQSTVPPAADLLD